MRISLVVILACFAVNNLYAVVPTQSVNPMTMAVDNTGIVVDESVVPVTDYIPSDNHAPARPLARIRMESGLFFDFIANEVLLKTANKLELNAFLRRWQGKILSSYHGKNSNGRQQSVYVIRIEPSAADSDNLPAQLGMMGIRLSEKVRVSNQRAKRLIAVMAQESALYNMDIGFSMDMLLTGPDNSVSLINLHRLFGSRR